MHKVLNLQSNYGVETILEASQYDDEARVYELEIYNGSEAYVIPDGAAVSVRGTKEDNTGFEYPLEVKEGLVVLPIKPQMTVFPGLLKMELRITTPEGFFSSADILLKVKPSTLKDGVEISETDLPLLETAEQHAAEAKAQANRAAIEADKATAAAESVANINITGTQTATGAEIEITDKEGDTTVLTILHGEKGEPGPEGPAGKDYVLTASDKAEIAESAAELNKTNVTGTQTATGADITLTDRTGNTKVIAIANGKDGTPGKDGQSGRDGTDGDSLIAVSEPVDNGVKITIKNQRTQAVETSFVLSNGERGETGEKGETGNGIQAAFLNSDYTLSLVFTDGTSYTTPSIRGAKGETGSPGKDGEPGKDGSDYVLTAADKEEIASAAGDLNKTNISGTQTSTGAEITLTDKTGSTTTLTVLNGEAGPAGPTGPAGADYVLTAADKTEIANTVYGMLTNASGQSF